MLKRLLLSTGLAFASFSHSFSQYSRSQRSYETSGLQKGDFVLEMFFYGVLCVIGWIVIHKMTVDDEKSSPFWGFVMMILGFAGFICFLPLLTWLEFIFVSVASFVIFLVVVGFIGMLIYGFFKK